MLYLVQKIENLTSSMKKFRKRSGSILLIMGKKKEHYNKKSFSEEYDLFIKKHESKISKNLLG